MDRLCFHEEDVSEVYLVPHESLTAGFLFFYIYGCLSFCSDMCSFCWLFSYLRMYDFLVQDSLMTACATRCQREDSFRLLGQLQGDPEYFTAVSRPVNGGWQRLAALW